MKNLSALISEDLSSAFDEVIDRNPGWNNALLVRALVNYFIGLTSNEQEDLVKKHSVKKRAKRRMKEIQEINPADYFFKLNKKIINNRLTGY